MRTSPEDPTEPPAPSTPTAPGAGDARRAPWIEIDQLTVGRQGTVVVRGEVDAATNDQLQSSLQRTLDHATDLVVDLREVTFMDSSGIAALLRARQRAVAAGGTIVLRDPSESVRRLLSITAVDQVLPIEAG